MKVTLIDYTGIGHPDPLYAARLLVYAKSTRLEQGSDTRAIINRMDGNDLAKQLDYIANTIRSSWEFVDFTFEIKGVTRAFTHQLVRTRTASYAQQAQRVVDMSLFDHTVPETVKATGYEDLWDEHMDAVAGFYALMKAHGIPAQDCRGVLPTNVNTNIIAKMNLRTLADLLAKRKNLRTQSEYADVAIGMESAVLEVMPWAADFLNPQRTSTPALDALLKDMLGTNSPIDRPAINEALKEVDKLKGVWG